MTGMLILESMLWTPRSLGHLRLLVTLLAETTDCRKVCSRKSLSIGTDEILAAMLEAATQFAAMLQRSSFTNERPSPFPIVTIFLVVV